MASLQEAVANAKNKEFRHVVSVSGGKDSTALAIYMLKNYPELPAEYVFCDTDKELPETYEYLTKLENLLGKPIQRINALDYMGIARKPGSDRNAFDIYLNEMYGGFLPSPSTRWCTRALKIEPFERFIGNTQAYSYIGIRADEDRDGYIAKKPPVLSQKQNIIPVYPFRDDGITLAAVNEILEDSGLGLPEYYEWRSRSGCYFCFYQQIGEWQALKERHPDLYEKAANYEKSEEGKSFSWVQGKSLDDITKLPKRELKAKDEMGCAICHL